VGDGVKQIGLNFTWKLYLITLVFIDVFKLIATKMGVFGTIFVFIFRCFLKVFLV